MLEAHASTSEVVNSLYFVFGAIGAFVAPSEYLASGLFWLDRPQGRTRLPLLLSTDYIRYPLYAPMMWLQLIQASKKSRVGADCMVWVHGVSRH